MKDYKWVNKETLKDEPTIALKNKVTADDLNYLKENSVEKVDNMISMDENGGNNINVHWPIVSKYNGKFKNMIIEDAIVVGSPYAAAIYKGSINLDGATAIEKGSNTGNNSVISINPKGLKGIYIGNFENSAPIEKTDRIATLKDLDNRVGYKIIITNGKTSLESLAGELIISKPENTTLLGGWCYIHIYLKSRKNSDMVTQSTIVVPIVDGFKINSDYIGFPTAFDANTDGIVKVVGYITPEFVIQNRDSHYVLKSTTYVTDSSIYRVTRIDMVYSAWWKDEN